MVGRDQPLDRDGSQVGDEKVATRLERLGTGMGDADAEARGVIQQSEEHRLRVRGQGVRLGRREQRIVDVAALLQHDQFAADHIGGGTGIVEFCSEPRRVVAPLSDALDAALGLAKMRLRAEVVARGHEQSVIPPLLAWPSRPVRRAPAGRAWRRCGYRARRSVGRQAASSRSPRRAPRNAGR